MGPPGHGPESLSQWSEKTAVEAQARRRAGIAAGTLEAGRPPGYHETAAGGDRPRRCQTAAQALCRPGGHGPFRSLLTELPFSGPSDHFRALLTFSGPFDRFFRALLAELPAGQAAAQTLTPVVAPVATDAAAPAATVRAGLPGQAVLSP